MQFSSLALDASMGPEFVVRKILSEFTDFIGHHLCPCSILVLQTLLMPVKIIFNFSSSKFKILLLSMNLKSCTCKIIFQTWTIRIVNHSDHHFVRLTPTSPIFDLLTSVYIKYSDFCLFLT